MKRILVSLLILAAIAFAGARLLRKSTSSSAAAKLDRVEVVKGQSVPVLVELFTSEGCSSCPPADELLTSLMEKQPIAGAQIVTLSEHVDYWNRLGWTDPYSSAEFSKRQNDYADQFGGDSVYTPEMVVDGANQFVGGDEYAAREAIENAVKSPKATVQLSKSNMMSGEKPTDVSLQIHAGNLAVIGAHPAEVMLAVTESKLSSNVTRGENSGHQLLHSSVVRNITTIGQVKGSDQNDFNATTLIHISDKWKPENLRVVVFLQDKANRRIYGAGILDLH